MSEIDSFLTMPYCNEAVETVSKNIRNLINVLKVPFAMEIVKRNFQQTGNQFSKSEFIDEVL